MKTRLLLCIFLFFSFPLFSQNTRLYFDFNSCALQDCSQQVLKDRFRDFGLSDSILIVGYADTSGTDSYNMELSKKRAEVIQKWFIENKIAIPVRALWKGETGVLYPYTGHENRRVEVIGFSKMAGFPKKEEQIFIINNLRDTIIQGKEGTRIKIPANAIVVPNGQDNNRLLVSLTEYYKASDILLNNLTTRTDDELLETNGMINLKIFHNKEVCHIRNDKPIQIGFPVQGKKNDLMRLFYSRSDPHQGMNWEESETPNHDYQPALMKVEEMPTFAGGDINDFQRFAVSQLIYPQFAIDNHICGRVIVGFTVDEKGLISDARIIRGAHSSLNAEVLRAVTSTPPWKPGKQGGKNVRVQFIIPIVFMMDEGCNAETDSLRMVEETYPGFTDSTIANLGINEINYYVFESLSLGWFNCDQYPFKNRAKSNLWVKIKEPGDVSAHILFMNYNSYLEGENRNGVFYFGQLPGNEDAVLLAVRKMENKIFWDYKKINTSEGSESMENFKEITFDDLNANIESLREEFR